MFKSTFNSICLSKTQGPQLGHFPSVYLLPPALASVHLLTLAPYRYGFHRPLKTDFSLCPSFGLFERNAQLDQQSSHLSVSYLLSNV
jgi:hypothetical protein